MTRILSLLVLVPVLALVAQRTNAQSTAAAAPTAAAPLTIGPFPEKFVWPISGTAEPDPINHTFGPRQYRIDQRYDFGRGIDIKVSKGTEVRAVAAGEVRIAGTSPAYKQPVVQLRHRKPGSAEGEYFYTLYSFLDEATVKVGDQVEQGAVIARSGLSPNGYEILNFSIRDGGASQANAFHPLTVLPYPNHTAPSVTIHSARAGKANSTVELSVSTDAGEPDFARLELEFTVGTGEPTRVIYDLAEWNRLYTPKDKSPDSLKEQLIHGLDLRPEFYQVGSDYRLTIRFIELSPAPNDAAIKVTAKAIDARGKTGEAKYPTKPLPRRRK
jgi:hypothetical protein